MILLVALPLGIFPVYLPVNIQGKSPLQGNKSICYTSVLYQCYTMPNAIHEAITINPEGVA